MYAKQKFYDGVPTKSKMKSIAKEIRAECPGARIVYNYSPSRDEGFVGAIFNGTPTSYIDGICIFDLNEFLDLVEKTR